LRTYIMSRILPAGWREQTIERKPRVHGLELDLLNWKKGRSGQRSTNRKRKHGLPNSAGGFRYVMIGAYQRVGEPFIEKIKSRIVAQKQTRRGESHPGLRTRRPAQHGCGQRGVVGQALDGLAAQPLLLLGKLGPEHLLRNGVAAFTVAGFSFCQRPFPTSSPCESAS
jgi:hypothetical protein